MPSTFLLNGCLQGVVKAYTTRVGGGPFATEDTQETGTKLQDIGLYFYSTSFGFLTDNREGREFGVTT